MTETTHRPTTTRLCSLARLYFDSVGAVVETTDDGVVLEFESATPPDWVRDTVADGRLVVRRSAVSGTAESGSDPEVVTLGPETAFARRLIDAAAERCPVASATVTGVPGGVETVLPGWVRAAPTRVLSTAFHPYYDSRVVCVWVRGEIETPSRYQRESLHGVVVDPDTGECASRDPTTLLEAAESIESDGVTPALDGERFRRATDAAGARVVSQLDEQIEEAERAAGRAAAATLDEYAESRRNRLAELQAERDRLESDLESVAERLPSTTGTDRVDLLERRERLGERLEAARSTAASIETAVERGFPTERARLRDRHAVDVRTRPVAVTSLSVERGDLSIEVAENGARETLEWPVGAATGLRETPSCPACSAEYGPENHLRVTPQGVACDTCFDD